MPKCLLCDAEALSAERNDVTKVECKICGTYLITGSAKEVLKNTIPPQERFRLSGLTRTASDAGKRLRIESSMLTDLLATAPVPRTPFEALDRLLLVIHRYMLSLTGLVTLEHHDYPLIYARSATDLNEFLEHLESLGYLKFRPHEEGWVCSLTLPGWKRIEELRRVGQASNQAFVAMWFDKGLDPAWTEGIHPALVEAGYSPLRIDLLDHNDRIDDRILAEIRRSGLVVADFTGDRGGVYFEAGFALGLGLPVIWCVKEDEIKNVHFDTRQYNHVTWRTPAELKEKLYNRVVASLGRPSSQAR